MIKFEHSVFALPFALTGALLAFREIHLRRVCRIGTSCCGSSLPWWVRDPPRWRSIASSTPISTRATRAPACATYRRDLLSSRFAWGFVLRFRSRAFLLAARELNPLCLKLAPLALGIVFFYSFTKRFTSLLAPGAGIFARNRAGGGLDRGRRVARPAHSLAHRRRHVLDRRLRHHLLLPGLRVRSSLPASSAFRAASASQAALWIARAAACRHDRLPACARRFISASDGLAWPESPRSWRCCVYEHSLVKADDLSRVDAAFFTVNGYVSVLFFLVLGRRYLFSAPSLNACSPY